MSEAFLVNQKIAIIGLGYVGLPIALAFAKNKQVVGFDINQQRIESLKKGLDSRNDVESVEFLNKQVDFTFEIENLSEANFYIVAVPTPIDSECNPDLNPLLSATKTIGSVLKKGDYVVFESTVYPGCTEEECVPLLEKHSGLKHILDFKTGFSPERINPGDKEHTFSKITKVVSGCDEEALENIAATYSQVVEAGIYKASSIKVAEAAKIIENTQRDLNIALMNELSIIFDRMNINTYEVLEAAGTKWNFLKFFPGLVGGHCIGVDPYYLTYKAKQLNYNPQFILSGRTINDNMGSYVAQSVIKLMTNQKVDIARSSVLIMGVTFKENVQDIRNSKVFDIVKELKLFNVNVEIIDPLANAEETKHEYDIELSEKVSNSYNAVILAVPHSQYLNLDESYFSKLCPDGLLADLKGIYRNKIHKLNYWSL
ncbi:MAG: nucleotide sugar dehydrogenase [Opitutaceae bacterium]|nr:nucleotide sugar dehydrogenase [Cytophagales bacterium]